MTGVKFKSYPKIPAFGYDGTEDILDGNIIIQPKIDGSNVAIWLYDGTYKLARRNGFLGEENGTFQPFIDWFKNEWDKNADIERTARSCSAESPLVLFGEFSNNQNKLKYENKSPFIMFDSATIERSELEDHWYFFGYDDTYHTANSFGWDFAEALYHGPGSDLTAEEIIETYLGKESILGGPNEEGVVVKSYGRRTRFGRNYFAKIVTAEFREREKVRIRTPKVGTGLGEWAKETFLTEARVRKGIQKMKEEGQWDSTNARKNIGKLIGTVVQDIHDEHYDEIAEKAAKYVWKEASKTISADIVNVFEEIGRKDSEALDHIFGED